MSQISPGIIAQKVLYTPSVPGNWSPAPANVYDALNQLALPGLSTNLEVTGVTLWAVPLVGEVGYISADGVLSRAKADSISTSGVIGTYQGTAGAVTVGGKVSLLFIPGLTILAGDKVFLSETVAGSVTNVDPLITPISGHVSFKIARVLSAAGYNTLTGGVLTCVWQTDISMQIQ